MKLFTKLLRSKVCSDEKYTARLTAAAPLCLICFSKSSNLAVKYRDASWLLATRQIRGERVFANLSHGSTNSRQ